MKIVKAILIISVTHFLLGCSAGREDELTEKIKTDSLTTSFQKSLADFHKRKIYKVLTSDIIDKTPDSDLIQLVFDNIELKVAANYSNAFKIITSLSNGRQAVFSIYWMEEQVSNGGFSQYYYNTSDGEFSQVLLDGLRLIGANKLSTLVAEANKLYKAKDYLGECDNKYFDLAKKENLNKLQIDFIRKNKTDFTDN